MLAMLMALGGGSLAPRTMYDDVVTKMDIAAAAARVFDYDEKTVALTRRRGARMLYALDCQRRRKTTRSLMMVDGDLRTGIAELSDFASVHGSCPELHGAHMLALQEAAAPHDCVAPPPAMAAAWRGTWNPLYELTWKPAMCAIAADRDNTTESLYWRHGTETVFAYAIPTADALRTIRDLAPEGRVMELCAGTGYWAALLTSLGAHVVACDVGREMVSTGAWFHVHKQPAHAFAKEHAANHALLVVYPRDTDVGRDADAQDLRAAFEHYAATRKDTGGVVFVVGERPDESTDNLAGRLLRQGWHIRRAVRLPRWPQKHDVLLALQYNVPAEKRDQSPLGLEMARVFAYDGDGAGPHAFDELRRIDSEAGTRAERELAELAADGLYMRAGAIA